MRKLFLMVLVMLTVLLTACGIQSDNQGIVAHVQQSASDFYVAEKLFPEDLEVSDARAGWCGGTSFYILSLKELWTYDVEARKVTKTVLDMGSKRPWYGVGGYVDDEGSLHALCLTWNEEKTDVTGYFHCVFDAEGKLISEKDCTESFQPIVDMDPLAHKIFLPNGKMLVFYKDEKEITRQMLLSETGAVLWKDKTGDIAVETWQLCEDERCLVIEKTPSITSSFSSKPKYMISEIDIETGTRKTVVKELPEARFFDFIGSRDAKTICYQTQSGIWECDVKSGAVREILSYGDVSLNAFDTGRATLLPDGSVCILVTTARSEDQSSAQFNFFKLNKAEENVETKIKTELTFAVVGPEELFIRDINSYNYSQDAVKVVLKAYENADLFVADVIAGNIPDLVDIGEQEIYLALEKKGLLKDLGEYMSKDGDISKADFLEKSLQFYEKDGKIYAIPYGLMISAMMGDEKHLGEKKSWNFEEFRSFIDTLPDPKMVTKGFSSQEMLGFLCDQYLGHFVDESKEECNFQTKEFYDFLECASIFSGADMDSMEAVEAFFDELQTGEIVLCPVSLGGIESYEYWRAQFPNRGRVIGLPAEDKNGICLTSAGYVIAMTAASEHADEAWDFIKNVMTKKKIGNEIAAFPSYKPFFEEMIGEARKAADSKEPSMQLELGDMTLDVPHATLSEIEMLQKLIEGGGVVKDSDETIIRMISEEASAYFNGSKSAEQVAELIQKRVKLYLSE